MSKDHLNQAILAYNAEHDFAANAYGALHDILRAGIGFPIERIVAFADAYIAGSNQTEADTALLLGLISLSKEVLATPLNVLLGEGEEKVANKDKKGIKGGYKGLMNIADEIVQAFKESGKADKALDKLHLMPKEQYMSELEALVDAWDKQAKALDTKKDKTLDDRAGAEILGSAVKKYRKKKEPSPEHQVLSTAKAETLGHAR